MSLNFFPRNSIVHLQCFYSFYSLSTVSATCQSFILQPCYIYLNKNFYAQIVGIEFFKFFQSVVLKLEISVSRQQHYRDYITNLLDT